LGSSVILAIHRTNKPGLNTLRFYEYGRLTTKNQSIGVICTQLMLESILQLNTVWVNCEGENAGDVENIGPINYMPNRGFPGYFFPYENRPGYVSPLVAVYFERPTRKSLPYSKAELLFK